MTEILKLARLFLEKAGIDKDLIVKKQYAKCSKWTASELICALITSTSATEAGKLLGASKDTVNNHASKLLSNIIRKPKGQRTWSIAILDYIEYKWCSKCSSYKPYSEYHNDQVKQVGVSTLCKICRNTYSKAYYESHVEESNAKNSLYRARKAQAIPSWADLEEIAVFYVNCPKGYHVDHIVPLNGSNVCGLHVINNLQYLLAEENLRKSNKYDSMA